MTSTTYLKKDDWRVEQGILRQDSGAGSTPRVVQNLVDALTAQAKLFSDGLQSHAAIAHSPHASVTV
jgi:hypothetical protein